MTKINSSKQKLLRPQNGIDRVTLKLHSEMFCFPFEKFIKKKEHYYFMYLRPDNSLIIKKNYNEYFLEINQEYFDTKKNYLAQIIFVLNLLVKNGFTNDKSLITRENLCNYIFRNITNLEFYFDFKKEYVQVQKYVMKQETAKVENAFFRYSTTQTTTNTYYSAKMKGKSHICIYDKEEKDKYDKISREAIQAHPYKTRIEFRLNVNNCNYMNIFNLEGTYNEIFDKYIEYLAVKYNSFIKDKVIINIDGDGKFYKIIEKAKIVNQNRFRNNDGKLIKSAKTAVNRKVIRSSKNDKEKEESFRKKLSRIANKKYFNEKDKTYYGEDETEESFSNTPMKIEQADEYYDCTEEYNEYLQGLAEEQYSEPPPDDECDYDAED